MNVALSSLVGPRLLRSLVPAYLASPMPVARLLV